MTRGMGADEQIAHLVYPFRTEEHMALSVVAHSVWHPSLLDQIEKTVTKSTMAGQVFHAAYGSKPAGRLDSIAFLDKINKQSREMALDYNVSLVPLRPRLRLLASALGTTTNPTVAGWWITARVLTQHDEPAMALNVPCPKEDCDTWGSVRVRFNPHIAFCTHCGSTWSEDAEDPGRSFGRLAVWVQWASEHLPGPEHIVGRVGNVQMKCPECLKEREGRAARIVERRSKSRH